MGAGEQMGARVIHDGEVACVVHVQVEVDVCEADTQFEAVFTEDVEVGQRAQMLADREGGNADEVDDVRHGVKLLEESVVEGG